uniref:MARVEL domain-containing protein n=1 Tax=Panagrellus redivivus TaxID=6233 RepID=A0A7E4W9U3_PANRE
MASAAAYNCQIQGCNVILLFLGLASVGLAGSQFSRVGLDNYRDIDLRLLNFFHVLTGVIGFYCVSRSHGSIVAKTMYTTSIVFAIATAIFYGFTTYRIVDTYRQMQRLQNTPGFEAEYGDDMNNHVGKIVISAVMIGISAATALVSMIAVLLLDRLVIVEPGQPAWLTLARDQEIELKYCLNILTSLGIIKLFIGLGAVGLAAFLEYEHELIGGRDNYIKIALDHIAGMLTVASAIIDLYAVFGRHHNVLNLKVGIAMSVIAAVWTLKSVDNGMFPYYKDDLRYYRNINSINEPTLSAFEQPRYIIVVAEGVLLGVFCLLFLLNCFTAVLAGCSVRRDAFTFISHVPTPLKLQTRFLGILHLFWAACLIALVLLGLCKIRWNGDYIGGDLLWQAMLFIAAAIVGSGNLSVMTTTRFVISLTLFGIMVEKTCASVNLIYQSVAYHEYRRIGGDTYTARIILNSCQCGVQFLGGLTALTGAVIYGRAITKMPSGTKGSNGIHAFFSLGTLFYGIVLTGSYVVFELGKWRYGEAPLDVPFYRLGNGPLAICVFIVQCLCGIYPRLLLAATILQVIIAALALFVISSAITNVYYLQVLLGAEDILRTNPAQNTIMEVAIILAAASALACVIATFTSIVCALRSSYLLHHRNPSTNSTTAVLPLEESFNTVASSPHMLTTAVQPMEEQTVYWSADENPYFYQTSKRYYNQPYNIDTGYYGYTRRLSPTSGDSAIGGSPVSGENLYGRARSSPEYTANSVRSLGQQPRRVVTEATQTHRIAPFGGRSEM